MSLPSFFAKTGTILSSRIARNVAVWIILLWFVHGMNTGNEAVYHYGIIRSSWYWPVIIGGLLLQLLLVYANNLLLIPRLLIKKRRLAYAGSVLLLAACISVLYTIGLKVSAAHMDIDNLQQTGLVTGPVSKSWSLRSVRMDTEAYLTGNLLWLLVFTMAWYMNDYARQRKAADEAIRRQAETELAFLRSQLNPHFLFNTLNNIYALALKEAAAAPDAILKLSFMLRYLLYESGHALVPFEKEAEMIRAYTDLELLRLKDVERLQFNVSADRSCLIPPLLWMPVLENIFKHGTRIISREIFVDFSFTIEENILAIKGRNYCKADNHERTDTGIGLSNLRKRLQLLYPGRHTVDASCSYLVFTTEVIIKLDEHAGADYR